MEIWEGVGLTSNSRRKGDRTHLELAGSREDVWHERHGDRVIETHHYSSWAKSSRQKQIHFPRPGIDQQK